MSTMRMAVVTFMALSTAAVARAAPVSVHVDPGTVLAHVPDDFMGLGYESSAVAQAGYFSADHTRLVNLYRNLSPHGLIRIGGNVSDHTVYEPDGAPVVKSQRETTVLNRASLNALGGFARTTGWRVMWGLNLGTGSKAIAVAEATDVAAALGDRLQSFEIGNEVDALPRFHHDYAAYHAAFADYRSAVRAAVPTAAFSGPDVIGRWDFLSRFAADEGPDLRLLTQHYYRSDAGRPDATRDVLLSTDPKLPRRLDQLRQLCRDHAIPGYRICETNSFSGGGKPGVSDTMAGALWALDYLFVLASHGAAGVNVETDINHLAWVSHYSPIVHDPATGVCSARPEYYGLLAFAAAAHGDVLATTVDAAGVNLTAYAAHDGGHTWVTIVNRDAAQDAEVTIDGVSGTAAGYRLSAPSLDAKAGVTFAGTAVGDDGSYSTGKPEAVGASSLVVPHAAAVVVRIDGH